MPGNRRGKRVLGFRSTAAASASSCGSAMPDAMRSVTSGSPVRVPSSMTTVSIRAEVSKAVAFLNSTPLRAQARAHHDRGRGGQAERVGVMTTTVMANSNASDRPSDGEPDQERPEATDQGDEYQPERGLVGQSLTGCLEFCASYTEGDDLRQGGGRRRPWWPASSAFRWC